MWKYFSDRYGGALLSVESGPFTYGFYIRGVHNPAYGCMSTICCAHVFLSH